MYRQKVRITIAARIDFMDLEYFNSKYELIKTYTARRSGATNMYLAGIPTLSIMKIAGHKTEHEFLKHKRVSKEETAEILANHEYFRPKLKKA